MVRFLLPTEERLKLEGEIVKNSPSLFPEYAGVTTRMSLFGVGDVSTSGALVEGGVAIGLAAAGTLLNALGPDGSSWLYSGFFVPGETDGIQLDSSEKVRGYAKETLTGRLQSFTAKEGLALKCIADCEENTPVFAIHGIKDKENKEHPLWISFIFRKPFKTKADPFRDAILGFHPVWNANAVMLTAEWIELNDNGQVITGKDGEPKKIKRPSLYSPIAHKMLRFLTQPGDFVYGVSFAYSHIAALQGRLYNINSKRAADFIDFEWR
jgi:hypothetical protein